MNHILSYNLFIEAKLFDLVKLNQTNNSNIEKRIKTLQEMEFDFSKKLIKYITLDKRRSGKKIRILIDWNNDALHDLYKRIKNRTSFVSIEDFNEYFKTVVNKILPDKIGTDISKSGKYSIYDKESNLTIIFAININDYLSENYKITIVTILPGRKGDNSIIKFLDI